MSTLELILVGILVLVLVLTLSAMLAWWLVGRRGRALAQRVGALPTKQKAALAGSLWGDPRLPITTRALLAGLVLYTALPFDIIPDFIPVLGQIDDIVMLSVGTALIVRSMPESIFVEHLSRLEAEVSREEAA